MEFLDILDENGNLSGKKCLRKIAHQQGILHTAIHILTYNSDNNILIQKRSLIKDSFPGKWDFILGGHVSAGETPDITALKELEEEYGIKTDLTKLKFLRKKRFSISIPQKNWYDNEFVYEYLLRYDGKISELILQREELADVKFYSLKNLEKDLQDPLKSLEYCINTENYYELINYLK